MRSIAQNPYRSVLLPAASLDANRLQVPDKVRRDFNKKQQKMTQRDQWVLRCKRVKKALDLHEYCSQEISMPNIQNGLACAFTVLDYSK